MNDIPPFRDLRRLAIGEVERTLETMPPEVLAKARELAILYEATPSTEMVAEGVEPDTLGLFIGANCHEIHAGGVQQASHIILFLEPIWDQADGEEEFFLEEVRATFLHELGHYLGLDEGDLEARGLG